MSLVEQRVSAGQQLPARGMQNKKGRRKTPKEEKVTEAAEKDES